MLNQQQGQLYHEALIKHHKNPVGFQLTLVADARAKGENATCGDEIVLEFETKRDLVIGLAFHGDSCAICRASASLLCLHLKDLPLHTVTSVNQQILNFILKSEPLVEPWAEAFSCLSVVNQFPVRKQCAVLPWTTLKNALNNAVK